jgi:hypothetical protein
MNEVKDLVQVSIRNFGAYFIYNIPVQRGIKGKTKSKVDEILAVGIPFKEIQSYCINNGLIITNKAIYYNNLDNPILYADEKGNYLKMREARK